MPDTLIIKPQSSDVETERVTGALGSRQDVGVYCLVDDSTACMMRAAWEVRARCQSALIVHAFGGKALAVAIAGTRLPIVFTPVGFPTRQLVGWLRAAMGYRDIHITCPSDTARRFMVTRGVPFERTHLIRPGVDFKSIPTGRNEMLRTKLGFSNSDTVVYCPLEMTHDADHSAAIWAMSILSIIRPEFRLLMWGHGKNLASIRDLLSRTIDRRMFRIVENDSPDGLFAAADGVLLTPADHVPMMSIAGAMASGKPIVSTITESVCELLEDRHTALLVAQRTPRAIAHRVIDLFADATVAWKLQDRARAEVYDHLTHAKMLELFRQVYQSASEQVRGSNQLTDSPTRANPMAS